MSRLRHSFAFDSSLLLLGGMAEADLKVAELVEAIAFKPNQFPVIDPNGLRVATDPCGRFSIFFRTNPDVIDLEWLARNTSELRKSS